jgi:hypothetical protein
LRKQKKLLVKIRRDLYFGGNKIGEKKSWWKKTDRKNIWRKKVAAEKNFGGKKIWWEKIWQTKIAGEKTMAGKKLAG